MEGDVISGRGTVEVCADPRQLESTGMKRRPSAPFFEFSPKTYLSRGEILEIAAVAAGAAKAYDVSVILTPPALDLESVKAAEPDLWVFAQGMDLGDPGQSMGALLPEALAAVGVDGVLLNHAERPLAGESVAEGIERAGQQGLLTMVWADGRAHARMLAHYHPDVLLAQPLRLMGTTTRADRPWIPEVNQAVREVDPSILVMHSGGITDGIDVFRVMSQGADGTGCTRAVVHAADRPAVIYELIRSARLYWDHARTARTDVQSRSA